MALFKKLSTARQSVIIDDIENLQSQINSKEDDITALQDRLDIGVAKINALQSLMTSHTSQLKTKDDTLALNLKIDNETIKTVALQSLTESHTSQITSHDGDINDLQGRLEILNDTLSNKQDTLTAGDNINIVNNVISSDEEVSQADLDLKQDLIQDGDLTIAKTDGLLTALDSTAKLASLNTFTGLQTVNGDLKADHVLVKITAPILNTHLTSKLYVDTALIGKQNT
jgi:sulfur transfer complex TusBCD TusB component (DsrH family)